MSKSTPASIELDKLNIPHRVFTHPGKVTSLEQAARERGQRPEQIVRSILFRTGENKYLIALVAGPEQISWKVLRTHLGLSRLTMANKDEVQKITGYLVGAVSPFGITTKLRILVDPNVFAEDEISIGSGIRGTTIILKSGDLRRALGKVEMVNLAKS